MTVVRRPKRRIFRCSLLAARLVRRALFLLLVLFFIANDCLLDKNTKGYYLKVLDTVYDVDTLEDGNEDSSFPMTRFTSHVKDVVKLYEFNGTHKCGNEYYFTVSTGDFIPTIQCQLNKHGNHVNPVSRWWCKILKRTFHPLKQRRLPHNVSFSVSTMDFLDHVDMYSCVGSSAYHGNFSMMNFQEIQRMKNSKEFTGLPWEKRSTLPIWRGTPWINLDLLNRTDTSTLYDQVVSPRLKAVDWSLRNPSLLDALAHHALDKVKDDAIWMKNSTSGLYKLIEKTEHIPEEEYYVQNQVTLVLCGLGASFRTSIHLSTATAVVLQECDYHEWFTSLLVPFQHYIPLAKDLSDIGERMKWIRENPRRVKKIAENGLQFYKDYLSFERNEEHIYEFVYRLSLKRAQYEQTQSPGEQAKPQNEGARMEIVSQTTNRVGNVEELETMCQALLKRAGDTEEGEEPWRYSGGLHWVMNDCAEQAESVLGNHLSRWYMIRAVAMAAGVSVEMPCRSSVTNRIENKVSPHDTQLDGGFKFSWKEFCRSCEVDDGRCRYPHSVTVNGLERIRSVILTDLQAMAYKVISEKPSLVNELDDVSIHLRCGDIARQDHVLYGMVPFRVYKSFIPKNVTSIGIVTAPFKQDREGWGPGDAELNGAVATAARDYLRDAFPNAIVTIRNSDEDTLDVVYARLIMTNVTVCGPSTFCVFPAIASLGQAYILQSPLFGGVPTWLTRIASAFPHVHYTRKRYYPSIDLYQLNTTDIVKKLAGWRSRTDRSYGVANRS